MDSIINEKRRLHETLLNFPPFFTYFRPESVSKSMKSPERSRSDTGDSSSIPIVESMQLYMQKQDHQFVSCRDMELTSSIGSLNSYSKYIFVQKERLSKEDTIIILKDL